MKSFSYLALISALAPFTEAGAGANGIDVLIPRVPQQNTFPLTGPSLPVTPPSPNKTYEYIVVGGGAGGSPLAADLALAGHSVLLIDAGGDYGHLREVETPALGNPASERNEVSWGFFTHHYANETQALRDRKLTWMTPDGNYYSGQNVPEGSTMLGNFYPRYGGLGGCSEHNALVGVLPTENDWDYIANITGDVKFQAENMREYWKQIEKVMYPLPNNDTSAHGTDGWLGVSINPQGIAAQDLKILSVMIGAMEALGYSTESLSNAIADATDVFSQEVGDTAEMLLPLNVTQGIVDALGDILEWDVNRDTPDRDTKQVVARLPMTMTTGDYRRASPRDLVYDVATATNPDGSKKYKLDVALHSLATKVNFDTTGDKPKAISVDYLFGESLYRADPRSSLTEDTGIPGTVSATREIIVSGGTFNTPQILKLSGVGPKEELEKWDIPVVLDLPGVGTNMQDRLEVGVHADATSNFTRILNCTYLGTEDDPCWSQYFSEDNHDSEKGTYASNGVPMGIFTTSSVAQGGEHDLWLGGFSALFPGFFPGYSTVAATPDAKNHWSWLILKAHTTNNAGTVQLASTNPRDTPRIDFHNLYEGQTTEAADADAMALVEGMKLAMSFYDHITPLDGEFERIWPPQDVQTDEELKQWIIDEAWGHHASCSAAIGADDNPMAVLDGQFRVRGIDGLRVVDASAFPKIVGTFPVVGVMLLAAKARDDILADIK
ncbi:Uu.00g121730.m01.CDS01 [Anthostomella pinea]|uniref:Uu.00g121730.m01.CDS01 n=1 Tax=Anthostomella pinea TaxID=933095 RepID=A0AAI8VI30_9PEZI|nr:Uu.00g121730.m01.CDS01 [Anthostomella pinea]